MDIVSGESDDPDDKVFYRKDRGANLNSIRQRRQVIKEKIDEYSDVEKESIDIIEKPKVPFMETKFEEIMSGAVVQNTVKSNWSPSINSITNVC